MTQARWVDFRGQLLDVVSVSQLPTIIADNAGYDSSELISQLRAEHADGKTSAGLG